MAILSRVREGKFHRLSKLNLSEYRCGYAENMLQVLDKWQGVKRHLQAVHNGISKA
jgi:hypothetical protein